MGLLPNTYITINNLPCEGSHNSSFETLNTKLDLIMASMQQLSARVAEQATEISGLRTDLTAMADVVNSEQQQVTTALDGLNAAITQLQQQITDGGTIEERQALLDQITGVRDNIVTARAELATAIEDIKSTIPDTPTEPGNGNGTPGDEPGAGTNEPATGSANL